MGANTKNVALEEAGNLLADQVIAMMKETNMPNGLKDLGYTESDLDNLTDKSFPQKRLLDNAPIDMDWNRLRSLFEGSLSYW